MTERGRLGSSGVFNAIVMSARKLKRALTGDDEELSPPHEELGNQIARAFVAGKFADVHAMGTSELQQLASSAQFESQWRDTVARHGPLTGFEVSNPGRIDLAFIPGLEQVPQDRFVVFLEITFGTPKVPLDDDHAFAVGAVFIDVEGTPKLGAIHAR